MCRQRRGAYTRAKYSTVFRGRPTSSQNLSIWLASTWNISIFQKFPPSFARRANPTPIRRYFGQMNAGWLTNCFPRSKRRKWIRRQNVGKSLVSLNERRACPVNFVQTEWILLMIFEIINKSIRKWERVTCRRIESLVCLLNDLKGNVLFSQEFKISRYFCKMYFYIFIEMNKFQNF